MPRKGMRSVFFHPASPSHNTDASGGTGASAAIHIFRATLMEDTIESAEKIIKRWDPMGSDYAKITSLFHESRDEARRFISAVNDLHHAMHFFSNSNSGSGSRSHSAILVRAQGLMQTAMKRLEKEFYQILAANRDRLDSDSVVSSSRSSLSNTYSAFSDTEDDIFDGGSNASLSFAGEDGADDDIRPATRVESFSVSPAVAADQRLPPGVMASLRSIAQCMVSAGYAYECVEVYKRIRSSILHEGLARLGFDLSVVVQAASATSNSESSCNRRNSKMIPDDTPILDRRVAAWIAAAPTAVRTLFAGERLLSDFVFRADGDSDGDGSSNNNSAAAPIKESCFAVIAMDAAIRFLAFPEIVAAGLLKGINVGGSGSKRLIRPTPERIFGLLGMYNALADLWPEIESIFSYSSTTDVEKQVLSSLLRLGEAIRAVLADLEVAVQKESSKTAVKGGGIHPLTQNVVNYVVSMADDYYTALLEVYADFPFQPKTPVPDSFLPSLSPVPSSPYRFDPDEDSLSLAGASSTGFPTSPFSSPNNKNVSARLAWLLLLLLCKLDFKAEYYNDSALSYLFMANNLRYLLSRVRGSKRLWHILGREWDANHEHKARSFFRSFERLAWGRVIDAIPADAGTFLLETEGVAGARDRMKQFNRAFEEACRKHASCTVLDREVREDLRAAVVGKVVEPYRSFYENCRPMLHRDQESIGVVRFAPEDVADYVADLYDDGRYEPDLSVSGFASPGSPAYSSMSGSSTSKSSRSIWRSAIHRFTRRRSRAGSWDLDSVPSSPSFSPARSN